MSDENEDLQSPGEESAPAAGESTPATPAAPSPYEKELAEVRARQSEIERLAIQASQAALQAQQNAYQTPQRSAYVEPEPEEDFDPTDKQQVRKLIDKRAREIAMGIARDFQGQIQSNYQQNDARFALMQRDRTYDELAKLGMQDLAPEVDEYIRRAQITPQYLSDPRSWETLAATVLGQRKIKEARENASRAPLLGSAGGRSAGNLPAPGASFRSSIIDDSDIARAKAMNVSDDPEELEMFLRGPVSVTDFEQFEAKRAARSGQRRR